MDPVFACLSLPAKSTRLSFPTRMWSLPSRPTCPVNITTECIQDDEVGHGLQISSHLGTLNGQYKHRMRAGGVFVHVRTTDLSVLVTDIHHMLNLLDAFGHKCRQILDINTSVWSLLQLEPHLVVLGQQVPNVLLRNVLRK